MVVVVVAWLDDVESRAWRGLVETFGDAHADIDADLVEQHGLTGGDYGVLVNLSEAPGRRLRMCDLAQRLHLTPSGLTRRLDGLVREGYVVRVPSDEDRRVTLASITSAGMAKLRAAAPDHVDSVRRHFLDHLSASQIREIGRAMSALASRREAAEQAH
jgi:DNA-binding MarR family transcriptional regulator